ncbi:hypothetical protein D3C77_530020 [compost metagenome]
MRKAKSLTQEQQGYLEALEKKARARNQQIAAVYAASNADLARAADLIKAALRGSAPIPRPRRFQTL